MAEGAEATVPATVRETVDAVERLGAGGSPVTVTLLAADLGLDTSSAWRRVHRAMARGYLTNEEARKSYPARLVLSEPLPGDVEILPAADHPRLIEGVCTFASPAEGVMEAGRNAPALVAEGEPQDAVHVGDVLNDGRCVLEMDAHGPVVVSKVKAPTAAPDPEVIE